MKEVFEFLSAERFYVFFADGSWRTCTLDQWRGEQLYKVQPVYCCWCGGEGTVKVLKAVIERFNASPI